MAGWDLLQQPYHRGPPVEPQIPKFDPTAVQLISHGTDTAVRALLGGIELGQRNRLEKEKMAQDLALTTEGHMIQRENNVMDYNIARQRLDQLDSAAATQKKLYGTAFQRNLAFAEQKANLHMEAGEQADKLKLTDLEYQTKHPMEYAKNAYEFERMYGSTVDPQLKGAVQTFVSKAEESKVKLDGVQYPWSQVVKDIAINEDKSPFVDMLQRNGFMDVVKSEEKVKTQKGEVPKTTTRTVKGEAKTMLEAGKAANFRGLKDVQSRVSMFGPKNATDALAAGTLDMGVQAPPSDYSRSGKGLPPPDISPAPETSEGEAAAIGVKNFIDMEMAKPVPDPAKIQAARALFKQKYGFDLD